MTKKFLPLLIITILVILMLGGCESYRKFGPVAGGDAAAIVTNNGGLAVKQGDYLYFINGFADYDATDPKTNFFGDVVKGSVMRGKLIDGALTEVNIVVPKKVMSSSPDHGISVYGSWIYYVSPGTGTDNKGNVLTDYIDFMRTSIDGTKTEKITTIKGNTTKFKFTANALVYYLDNKLVSIDLSGKKFKETTIDEEVVSVLFPNNPTYNPSSPVSPADYVFYTKKAESDLDTNNVVYVVNANGENKSVLIDKTTFAADANDLANVFTISLLSSSVTGNKLAIYYTKKTVATIAAQDRGLFGYEFDTTTFAINKANEKQFSLNTTSKIFPVSFTKGVFILDETPNVLAFAKGVDDLVPLKTQFSFPSEITMLGVDSIGDKDYAYYIASNAVHRFPLDQSENAAVILTDTIRTGWAGPDFIDGMMIYISQLEYDYTYMVKLDTYSITDSEAIIKTIIGEMSADDIEKKAADEAEKEDL